MPDEIRSEGILDELDSSLIEILAFGLISISITRLAIDTELGE